ncbi:ABC transporter ATP-binding protein [Bradyrhizobium sp. KB893862 SZCCT0404]|uniref:ABC transporter ATP-binding protein n=1 Tax=Bradyrhizobium sp. KB893862 SZCCT0404 TaxID=2807672 RepID=UPI001BA98176|nr:ABC transporter ATP-binding protein [Bradyrhizobium sp. KB893862 SZCCT0404]MBR1177220.1 ABC transporter ATP-binding protein [Bradyrhizobium sp. KB893862 SZCCT0404]
MAFGTINCVRKVFPVEELGSRATEPVVALDDASFTFERGELVALLGPSGCGKTTLLRIVAGLIEKTAGSVTIDGREVDGPLGDYGFVFQAPSLMPWRSVIDNVLFPMEILKRSDRAARARAAEFLELVGLSKFHNSRPHQLSGGMQQRVALCRALIHRPNLLLMDEPFGALDELTRLEMNDLLLRIRKETGASVLFVTHSISEAVYLADQVIVFSRRPARVSQQIRISLPYPRSQAVRFTPAFTQAERAASEALGIVPHLEAVAS